jgi:hypothetical protein
MGPCGRGDEEWWSIALQIVGKDSLPIRGQHVGEIGNLKEHADQVDTFLLHCQVPTEMNRDHGE